MFCSSKIIPAMCDSCAKLSGMAVAARIWTPSKNGEEALAYLRRQPPFAEAPKPDLIFLDLNLPKKDGREVLLEIKKDESLRRIPVVVLTTSEAERDILRAYDLHANCYVKKPTELDEYMEVIRACENFWLHIVRLPR